jgi:hypothetical protein
MRQNSHDLAREAVGLHARVGRALATHLRMPRYRCNNGYDDSGDALGLADVLA